MVNYDNAKIYKIQCNETGETYYGSTVQALSKRKSVHKDRAKHPSLGLTSTPIINRGNWNMCLVESYPCKSKEELFARERHYIETCPCVNKIINNRDIAEKKERKAARDQAYREGPNREAILEKKREDSKAYHQKHEPIQCGCGSTFFQRGRNRHLKTEKHKDYLATE